MCGMHVYVHTAPLLLPSQPSGGHPCADSNGTNTIHDRIASYETCSVRLMNERCVLASASKVLMPACRKPSYSDGRTVLPLSKPDKQPTPVSVQLVLSPPPHQPRSTSTCASCCHRRAPRLPRQSQEAPVYCCLAGPFRLSPASQFLNTLLDWLWVQIGMH